MPAMFGRYRVQRTILNRVVGKEKATNLISIGSNREINDFKKHGPSE